MNLKATLLVAVVCCLMLGSPVFAQRVSSSNISDGLSHILPNYQDCAPGVVHSMDPVSGKTTALWDIKFNYDLTASCRQGNAGIVWTGTEFWVSRWQSDSLFRLNSAGVLIGSFTIPGVTGIRSMTLNRQDGHVYAGLNTTTIHKINTTTRTSVGTITAPQTVRWITYDSTAASGAGGFWIGNFSSDINQISMTGSTLATISSATHGLGGMYGAAIDHWTIGGPYLWIFSQSLPGSTAQILRLSLATGTPTGVIHDVLTDVGTGVTGAVAGGLYITKNGFGTTMTIMGILQGTPNHLFGYELNDPPPVDAALQNLLPSSPFLITPQYHVVPVTFTGEVLNSGSSSIPAVNMVTTVEVGGTGVYSNTSSLSSLASGATGNITTSTSYTPGAIDEYKLMGVVNCGATTDPNPLNDSLYYSFFVSDTVFAREDGNYTGSLGIGDGTGGILGQVFRPAINDKVTSITAYFNNPTAGDQTKFYLYDFPTLPVNALDSSAAYTFTTADTNGVLITMPLLHGDYAITGGTDYFVGVRENTSNVTLATTSLNWRAAGAWVIFGSNPWAPIEDYGFNRTFVLRMNVEGLAVGNEDALLQNQLTVFPNPADQQLNIMMDSKINGSLNVLFRNTLGQVVREISADASAGMIHVGIDGLAAGVYLVQVTGIGLNNVVRVQVIH